MNLQINYSFIQRAYETCSKMYVKVSEFEKHCKQIDNSLDLKLKNCKSDLSLNKKNW